MAKNLKIKIKNTQLAKAINLGGIKAKSKKAKSDSAAKEKATKKAKETKKTSAKDKKTEPAEETQVVRRKAKKKSSFTETGELLTEEPTPEVAPEEVESSEPTAAVVEEPITPTATTEEAPEVAETAPATETKEKTEEKVESPPQAKEETPPPQAKDSGIEEKKEKTAAKEAPKEKKPTDKVAESKEEKAPAKEKHPKKAQKKEYKDIKTLKKGGQEKSFDARDRMGLRAGEEEGWRKRRPFRKGQNKKLKQQQKEETTIRPSKLKVRTPISIKDLASAMKLKATQLISNLFMQGIVVTLNDSLDDETTIQLLGEEFSCEITIDTSEEERIRITDETIKEEINAADAKELVTRPVIIAFMGHVDHGKTSIIDKIRKSSLASGEAGAITQHIGAFRHSTNTGDITILDTPGHEAFSAMRARGADVTDLVVLVVAGDEGIRQQTSEAIQHAKAAGVTIIVAINKCDKPSFDAEKVYRQLADIELLPEAWGGSTITVNTSATTGEGIEELLEMAALQAEMLELKANPSTRARGTILEAEMHKGMGAVATLLIQNGSLKKGDALVLGTNWGRVKTLTNENGKTLASASPSTPVEITGISGLPNAGEEFIVVSSEKEAREIASARKEQGLQSSMQARKPVSIESLFQQASDDSQMKILNIILRADMQGSLEALKAAISNIKSDKIEANIIFSGVGEVAESDVQLAASSKAIIVGFHTQIESHAEGLIRDLNVHVSIHGVIYHAVDHVKGIMTGLLDKLTEEKDVGAALVQATFKASQLGVIAGCIVTDGMIHRNHLVRILRDDEIVWKGSISSIKREKDDVREVSKGLECGILLNGFNGVKEGDTIQSYEIIHIEQEL